MTKGYNSTNEIFTFLLGKKLPLTVVSFVHTIQTYCFIILFDKFENHFYNYSSYYKGICIVGN